MNAAGVLPEGVEQVTTLNVCGFLFILCYIVSMAFQLTTDVSHGNIQQTEWDHYFQTSE